MKFCTRCGNQMFDDAVICTKCGKLDESFPYNNIQPQINRSQAPKMAKESVIASIFSFISSILSVFSLLFLSFAVDRVHVDTYSYIYGGYRSHISYMVWEPQWSITALCLSVCAIGFGLTSLIISSTKRQGLTTVLSRILNIVIGAVLLTVSVLFTIY